MKLFFKFSLILLVFSIGIIGCKKNTSLIGDSSKKEIAKSRFAHLYPHFNPGEFRDLFKERIQSDTLLSRFYSAVDYTPIWLGDTLNTKNLYEFIKILENADNHGLSAEMFNYNNIKEITDSINSGHVASESNHLYEMIFTLEKTATAAVIKYTKGMRYGFLNPKELFGKDYYDITLTLSDSLSILELYREIKKDPVATIKNSEPSDNIYAQLKKEYEYWKQYNSTNFGLITNNANTYKAGNKSKHITEIARRLLITGEYNPQSLNKDSLPEILDEELLNAINSFRKKNSYPEENEVGKITIDALNRSADYYRNKLRANLERYRWKRTKSTHEKHIEVNVAAAMLVASQNDSLPLPMRVCVGTVNNKTPLLQSDIDYINLNPVWNVPKSIARNEVAILQKRDTSYIRKKNMKLYKGGQEVDVNSIDWSSVNPSTFSYIVRQEPGYGNSLGLIKFMFKNEFSVYLHDTPSKLAFNRKNRAVSHGCVRVQKPLELAFFCLSPVSDVYKDQLRYSIMYNPITKEGKKLLNEAKLKKLPNIINVAPKQKISLFIDYYTAFLYPDDDKLYYADDIYNYDTMIVEALENI